MPARLLSSSLIQRLAVPILSLERNRAAAKLFRHYGVMAGVGNTENVFRFLLDRSLAETDGSVHRRTGPAGRSIRAEQRLDEEIARLRNELADREQALSVTLQERQELEAGFASWRDMATQRRAELTRAAEDRERQLQREQTARSEAQAELDRLRGALATAEAGPASAQQECSRLQAELTELHAEADRDRKGYDDRMAELTRAAGDRERQLQTEQTARAEAQAERERLRGALKKVESERTAAQKDVEQLQHQLTDALAEANRDRSDYEARLAGVNRQLAEREQRAAAQDRSLNASESARRAKSRARAADAAIESDAAGPAASSIDPATHDLEVHFRKPADWAQTVFVYYWNTEPATEKPQWLGVPLAAEADGWRMHRLSRIRSAHLVFNDNAGKQTRNFYRDRPGWLDADGTWQTTRPASSPLRCGL